MLAGLVMIGVFAPAHAAPLEVRRVDLVRIESRDDTHRTPARPQLKYRVVVDSNLPGLTAARFRLERATKSGIESVRPVRVVRYVDSDGPPLALVVLVQANGRWMGGAQHQGNPDARVGGFSGAARALDVLAGAGPRGSRAVVLVFGGAARSLIRYEGPLHELSGKALGAQGDYRGIGVPLSSALQLGLERLRGLHDVRRVLVVIGDGTGEVQDVLPRLRATIDALKHAAVESFAIHFSADGAGRAGEPVSKQIGYDGWYVAASPEAIATHAGSIRQTIGARYHVIFPVFQAVSPHESPELILRFDDQRYTLTAPPFLRVHRPQRRTTWPLWYLALPLVLIVVVGLIVRRRLHKAEGIDGSGC